MMKAELPATADEARDLLKDYPHTKEELTKKILSAKLKAVRGKFRNAVDSGRRSGHGRVVLLYYELCEKVWGGSPATQQLNNGVETGDIVEDAILPTPASPADFDEGEHAQGSPVEPENGGQETVRSRREYLDDKLKNYKTQKMKRKLPMDAQVLACAKEDLAVKKRLVEQMDKFDQEYCESIQKLTTNIEKISNSISEGFAVLKMLMTPPPVQPSVPYPVYNAPRPYPFDMNTSLNQPYDSATPSPSGSSVNYPPYYDSS